MRIRGGRRLADRGVSTVFNLRGWNYPIFKKFDTFSKICNYHLIKAKILGRFQ